METNFRVCWILLGLNLANVQWCSEKKDSLNVCILAASVQCESLGKYFLKTRITVTLSIE